MSVVTNPTSPTSPTTPISPTSLTTDLFLSEAELKIVYIPGRKQLIADALSRHPTDSSEWPFNDPSIELCSVQNRNGCNFAICHNTVDSDYPNLVRFNEAASKDDDYCNIVIKEGLKRGEKRKFCDKTHSAYFLSYLWHTLRIIPFSECNKTLEVLHHVHLGFANTYNVARSCYYCENMRSYIEKFIAWCGVCIGVCIEYQDCRPFKIEMGRSKPITSPMHITTLFTAKFRCS